MENKRKKVKKIFSKRLCYELRRMGFDVIATQPNKYQPQFDVYLFKDTDFFEKALSIAIKKIEEEKRTKIDNQS
jgi:hypothetical protein